MLPAPIRPSLLPARSSAHLLPCQHWAPHARHQPRQVGRRTGQRSEPLDPLALTQQPVAANLWVPAEPLSRPPPSRPSLVPGPRVGARSWGWPALTTPGQPGPSLSTGHCPPRVPASQGWVPRLDGVGRKVSQEVDRVRVVHHGQQGEGIPGKPEELGQVPWAREWPAGAELLADRVIGCQEEWDKGLWSLQAHVGEGEWGAGRQGAASSPPCRNKSLICRKASRTAWAHSGLWPSKSWRKEGCGCTRRLGCLGEGSGAGGFTYCRDVPEELVGVTEACHRDDRCAGRQCPRHEVRVLYPHVGAEHPPIAGQGRRVSWVAPHATPAAPRPRRPRCASATTPASSLLSQRPHPMPPKDPKLLRPKEILAGARLAFVSGEKKDKDAPPAKGDGGGVPGPKFLPKRPEQPRVVGQGLLHRQQLRVPAAPGPLTERERLSVVPLWAGEQGSLTPRPGLAPTPTPSPSRYPRARQRRPGPPAAPPAPG